MKDSIRRAIVTVSVVFSLLFALSVGLMAQQQPDSSSSKQTDQQNEKKDKKKKKKDKKQPDDAVDTAVFSEAVANNVMNDLRDGLEGHVQRLMLSAFDEDKMDGYLSFEDQIEAFFNRYESFTVHYRILQTSVEGAKGVVLVSFEMEEIPKGSGSPVRKSSQIRFELERGKKGWKIVDFNPKGFFS